jgi:phosphomannomutase
MNIPEGIFKALDIRGTYPDQLNGEAAAAIAKSIAAFFLKEFPNKKPKLVLGRDMRLSSPEIHEAMLKVFLESGVDIIDLGLVPTPTVYFATRHFSADGGVQITASHNPKDYNGIKLVKNAPNTLIKIGRDTGMDEIKKGALEGVEIETLEKGEVEEINRDELMEAEVDNALKISGYPEIKKFKIVADAANAMAAVYLEALFKKVPADLVKINFELDGTFPAHPADPLVEENLKELKERVVSEQADLGLAPDGDGDRLFFVDEQGNVVKSTIIYSIVARELLKKHPGAKMLMEIRNLLIPRAIVTEHGGELIISKTGHAFITSKLAEVDGLFAGETSGHFFFKETGNAESQIPIILIVLSVLTAEGKKFSELVKEFTRSYESGEVNFEVENSQELMDLLKDKYKEGELLDIDGVSISFPDWRFNLRTSNTEPLIRLNVEHLDFNLGEEKKRELIQFIEEHRK